MYRTPHRPETHQAREPKAATRAVTPGPANIDPLAAIRAADAAVTEEELASGALPIALHDRRALLGMLDEARAIARTLVHQELGLVTAATACEVFLNMDSLPDWLVPDPYEPDAAPS